MQLPTCRSSLTPHILEPPTICGYLEGVSPSTYEFFHGCGSTWQIASHLAANAQWRAARKAH
eukprot:scaffold168431_cov30-Tisochrysis_lutea.AAC.3